MSVSSRASDGRSLSSARSRASTYASRASHGSRASHVSRSHHNHIVDDDTEIFELRCNRCDGQFQGVSDLSILECYCVLCHGCARQMVDAGWGCCCPCCGSDVSDAHRMQLTNDVTNGGTVSPSNLVEGPLDVQRAIGHVLRPTAFILRPGGSYGPKGVTSDSITESALSLMEAVRTAAAVIAKQMQSKIAATQARRRDVRQLASQARHEFQNYRRSSRRRRKEGADQLEQLQHAIQEMQQLIDQERRELEEAERYMAAQQQQQQQQQPQQQQQYHHQQQQQQLQQVHQHQHRYHQQQDQQQVHQHQERQRYRQHQQDRENGSYQGSRSIRSAASPMSYHHHQQQQQQQQQQRQQDLEYGSYHECRSMESAASPKSHHQQQVLQHEERQRYHQQQENQHEERQRYHQHQQDLENGSYQGSRSMGSVPSRKSHQSLHHQQHRHKQRTPPNQTLSAHHQQPHNSCDGPQQQNGYRQIPHQQPNFQNNGQQQLHHQQHHQQQLHQQPKSRDRQLVQHQQPIGGSIGSFNLRNNGCAQPSQQIFGQSPQPVQIHTEARESRQEGIPSVISFRPMPSSNDSVSTVGIDMGGGHTSAGTNSRLGRHRHHHQHEPHSHSQTTHPSPTTREAPVANRYLAQEHDAVAASRTNSRGTSKYGTTRMVASPEDRRSHCSQYSHVPNETSNHMGHYESARSIPPPPRAPHHSFSPHSTASSRGTASGRWGTATGAALGHAASPGIASYAPLDGDAGIDDATVGFDALVGAMPGSHHLASDGRSVCSHQDHVYRSLPGHDDLYEDDEPFDDPHLRRVMPPAPPPPHQHQQQYRPTDFGGGGGGGGARRSGAASSSSSNGGRQRDSSHRPGEDSNAALWTASHPPHAHPQRSTSSGRATAATSYRRRR